MIYVQRQTTVRRITGGASPVEDTGSPFPLLLATQPYIHVLHLKPSKPIVRFLNFVTQRRTFFRLGICKSGALLLYIPV